MANIPYAIFLLTTVCIVVNSIASTHPDGLQTHGGGHSRGLGVPENAENISQAPRTSETLYAEIANIPQEAPSSFSNVDDNDDDDDDYDVGYPITLGTMTPATTPPTTPVAQDPNSTETTTEYVPDAPRLPEVCMLEPEQGFCHIGEAGTPGFRYFFNHIEKECELFDYSGCNGNGNNFKDEAECKNRCQGQPYDLKEHARLPSVCKERVSKGTCVSPKGPELRYFYNQYNQSCQLFTFIGGVGNGNNFRSLEECERRCIYTPDGECALHPNKGLCSGNFVRYYWDKDLGDCEKFNYTGCAGNGNNFGTKEECQKFCKAKSVYLELWKRVWDAMESWKSRGYS